jgi:hypothetical protein
LDPYPHWIRDQLFRESELNQSGSTTLKIIVKIRLLDGKNKIRYFSSGKFVFCCTSYTPHMKAVIGTIIRLWIRIGTKIFRIRNNAIPPKIKSTIYRYSLVFMAMLKVSIEFMCISFEQITPLYKIICR